MKRLITCLALLATVSIASATNTTNLVMDGDFESPNGDVGPWGNMFGGDSISFLSTGGNPNGCVQISDAGSFGGIAYVNPPSQDLASLGLVAGQTYTFLMDMQIVSGENIGGLKIESWTDTAIISDSGNMYPLSGTTDWATYSFTYRINPGATHLNIVPLWGPNSTVNYDNIAVVVVGVTPVTVAITDPTNNEVVGSNFTIHATASVSPGTVTNVAFYVDNTIVGNATNSPFGFIETGLAAGSHALKAVATDSSGNIATSSVIDVTVTNAPAPAFGAYEPFNYDSLSSGTPTTGTGFTGNWSCGAAGTIVPGLTYPGLAVADNALQSSSFYQLESLANPPSGVGSVWVSFIFNQSGDNGGNRDGFALEDSTGKGVMFAYQQFQATFGEPALTTVSGFTAVGSQLTPNSQTTQIYNTNNFYVLQLTYSGGSLSSVAVYSNPTARQGTPPAPDFTVTRGLTGIGALSVLGIVHQAGIQITLDEIRAGNTFADVVGANLMPTVPTTLALSITPGKQVSWNAVSTNYYQPQSSSDGFSWNNLGNILFGTNVTSVFDFAPLPFYQVVEILPVSTEQVLNGGFETSDGFGGAGYWIGGGSQPPMLTTADFHTGTESMSLFVTNSGAAAQTCDLQQNILNMGGSQIAGGTAYQFSFWAKSQGRNPAGGYVQRYKLTWLDMNSAIVGAIGFSDFAATTNAWTQINVGSVIAPTNAVDALIEIFAATGGVTNDYGGVLIDDVSLAGSTPSGDTDVIPATVRDAAQFSATINANGGTTAPSGTITFTTNSILQSSMLVANGMANSTPAVVPASYNVTAVYSGDATYIGSTNTMIIGTGVNPTPVNITTTLVGNQLTLSWPADHIGWTLQSQSDSLNNSLGGAWQDVAGSTLTNQVVITVNPASPVVFYRMKY
ncbi:MAG TPA: Ig-like domain-containing protein [Verrucomicrobiae bacterium]|jgi:hypothetical protein|nr:Ig-like domain-containing protein [Verrucomicrobiae bacterium]